MEMEKGDKKMRDEKMGDCPRNSDAQAQKSHSPGSRHSEGGGPKLGGAGEGSRTGISQLKGKPCSCRLQCYNMPALKEIKEIKRSVWVSRSCRADSYPA